MRPSPRSFSATPGRPVGAFFGAPARCYDPAGALSPSPFPLMPHRGPVAPVVVAGGLARPLIHGHEAGTARVGHFSVTTVLPPVTFYSGPLATFYNSGLAKRF